MIIEYTDGSIEYVNYCNCQNQTTAGCPKHPNIIIRKNQVGEIITLKPAKEVVEEK